MASNVTTSPITIAPSSYWGGNDGLWNSFDVSVGTPGQGFRLWPTTAGYATVVWVPNGWTSDNPSDYPYFRGSFDDSASTTWQPDLSYEGDGCHGLDVVTWGSAGTGSVTQHNQTVVGTASGDYYIGIFGLGPEPSGFMRDLSSSSRIPSLSWAYTAGAAYRNQTPASLTLGGYDASRISGTPLSIDMSPIDSRFLQVAVQKISTVNSLQGTLDIDAVPSYYILDSTAAYITLPSDTVDAFVEAFGLTYDNSNGFFRVNETIHSRLLELNPTISFLIGAGEATSDTITINLPYAAFDLQAGFPFYENATNYFPIRYAESRSHYTIGRTFFQEAYIIADYERKNFTIAQVDHDNVNDANIVSITRASVSNVQSSIASSGQSGTASGVQSGTTLPQPDNSSGGLTGGAIAGIVVGALVGLAILAFATWFILRKKKQSKHNVAALATEAEESSESHPENVKPRFLQHTKPELPHDRAIDELPSTSEPWEVHGKSSRPPKAGLVEAAGSEGKRYELPDSEL